MSGQHDESRSMADELHELAEGLDRREEQLRTLNERLDRAEAELGLDLDAVKLPENPGAILDHLPEEPVTHEDPRPEPEPAPAEEAVHMPVRAEAEKLPAVPEHETVPVRDPAVIELLHQSAGLVQRHEHMRVSVENLDKKVDLLARQLHDWRAEDDRRRAEEAAKSTGLLGAASLEVRRLVAMGLVFLVIVVLWHLLTSS